MDTLNFEQIGEKLKKIRLSKNLTQEYIANAADVNTSHISNIENNRVKVSLLFHYCRSVTHGEFPVRWQRMSRYIHRKEYSQQ